MKHPVKYPIEEFFPQLALDPRIIEELNREAGDRAEQLRQGMLSDSLTEAEAREVAWFIHDVIINEGIEVDRQLGLGAYEDPFPIMVMQFGPIYWVDAQEFDNIGFFKSQEEAEEFARDNYIEFIMAHSEFEDKDEDDE